MTPERWFVLELAGVPAELRPVAAEKMVEMGGGAVEDRDGVLSTYLAPPGDPEAKAEQARARIAESLPALPVEISWRWQADEDWAAIWKRGLQPRKLTERVVVKPTWTAWDAAPGEVVLEVDPQMAFGTGEHPTTRACLRLLDGAIRTGDRVLDVGSGSAILSIAAARLGAEEVVAVEYDRDANLNARENLARNGVGAEVCIVEALADTHLLAGLGRFDLILANILSGVIRPLLPAFRATLADNPDGRLIVSGILRTEHGDVVRDAEAAGFRVARVDEEDDFEGTWWSALLLPVS